MKVAVYARVSTTDQTCESQLRELREYAARRGWEVYREYIDTGWSGSKATRPQLDRLMKEAREKRFDVVVVWKLDRWGRSLAHLVESVKQLAAMGVRFLAVTQNIDTDENNPMARLLMHLMAAFAEFEREMIRERVASGVKRYQADYNTGAARSHSGKNLPIGRPKRVFHRDEAQRLRADGMSWRSIARRLGVPVSTVVDACNAASGEAQPARKATARQSGNRSTGQAVA